MTTHQSAPNKGAFVKGQKRPNQGRPKGVVNKTTAELKEAILKALDKAGGVDYLARQADESPAAFLALIGKVLPMTVAGDGSAPIVFKVEGSWLQPSIANRNKA